MIGARPVLDPRFAQQRLRIAVPVSEGPGWVDDLGADEAEVWIGQLLTTYGWLYGPGQMGSARGTTAALREMLALAEDAVGRWLTRLEDVLRFVAAGHEVRELVPKVWKSADWAGLWTLLHDDAEAAFEVGGVPGPIELLPCFASSLEEAVAACWESFRGAYLRLERGDPLRQRLGERAQALAQRAPRLPVHQLDLPAAGATDLASSACGRCRPAAESIAAAIRLLPDDLRRLEPILQDALRDLARAPAVPVAEAPVIWASVSYSSFSYWPTADCPPSGADNEPG